MLTMVQLFRNGPAHSWFYLSYNIFWGSTVEKDHTQSCVRIKLSSKIYIQYFLHWFSWSKFTIKKCWIIGWSRYAHSEWHLERRFIKTWKDFTCIIWPILSRQICTVHTQIYIHFKWNRNEWTMEIFIFIFEYTYTLAPFSLV